MKFVFHFGASELICLTEGWSKTSPRSLLSLERVFSDEVPHLIKEARVGKLRHLCGGSGRSSVSQDRYQDSRDARKARGNLIWPGRVRRAHNKVAGVPRESGKD